MKEWETKQGFLGMCVAKLPWVETIVGFNGKFNMVNSEKETLKI
jgi:hypothetical protein